MGASLGNWEFLSQTNDNADCVPLDDRFKFVDDLTTLEIINLINIGISSFRMQNQVPSDIPTHGQYVEGRNLKSQKYLNQINTWTKDHQMVISEKKTKVMIFNFTENFQFATRLELKGKNVEMVDNMKILGTIVRSDLSWDDNCELLIKKVNGRGATPEGSARIWCLNFGDGPLVDSILSLCSGAVMRSVEQLTHTRE